MSDEMTQEETDEHRLSAFVSKAIDALIDVIGASPSDTMPAPGQPPAVVGLQRVLGYASDRAREPYYGSGTRDVTELVDDVLAYDLDQAISYVAHRMLATRRPRAACCSRTGVE